MWRRSGTILKPSTLLRTNNTIGSHRKGLNHHHHLRSITPSHNRHVSNFVDLRSDTVTKPSKPMLQCIHNAPLGDDVMGEDPTVLALEEYTAHLFGKQKALFIPTGTMGNLLAIFSHCHGRASEMIIGSQSHICLWEGGGAANLGGVSSKQIEENVDGTLDFDAITDCYRVDNDDHFAKTELICLENSHNMMGGKALQKSYIDEVSVLAKSLNVKMHIDGARIFNASVHLGTPVNELCEGADSVSVCLSKGLGAPLGSVLVGESEFIRQAKRARKRVGGGMRQVGVVASMGMYAIQNNVDRLALDHERAKKIARSLHEAGFRQPQSGNVDTNIVYFGLPENTKVSKEDFAGRLKAEHGVLLGSGYNKGGELFRICTHLDLKDEDIDKAIDSIIRVCLQ